MHNINDSKTFSYKKVSLIIGIFIVLLGCILPSTKINAATLKIRYGGKNYSYTSAQAGVSLDGNKIDLRSTPGVLINDTCMVSAKDVFGKALGATYQIDGTTNQIVIAQNDITLIMTLNSKTAYINGKKVTCDVAPMKIKFVEAGKTKVYVPARFVADALGYSYNWNSTSKISEMKKPFVIKYNGTWTVYKGTQGKVNFDGEDIKLSGMPSIVLDGTSLLRASTVFKSKLGADYTYNKTTRKVTIAQNGTTIEMTINSNKAVVNGQTKTMGTAARVVYNQATQKSFIMVPGQFVASNLGYEYKWNASTKTSLITTGKKVYLTQSFSKSMDGQASLVSIEASCSDKTDILRLTGSEKLDITEVQVDSENIQLTISNVYSNVEELSNGISDSYYFKGITLKGENNAIIINVNKEAECNYYTKSSGKVFELVLCENANADIDKSGFQLKFSMPEGLDYNSITTEDRYYDNKFIIYLSGDYSDTFDTDQIKYSSTVVKNVDVTVTNAGNTAITVHTKSLKGFKLNNCGDYVGVNIANPSSIYDKIIVLDAGHGGKDNGASSKGTKEKDLNLKIIYTLAKEYFDSDDSNIKAYWTRHDDTFITLDQRAAFASKVDADIFVSLHMNSASATASGLEVFYSKDNSSKMGSLTSQKMATLFYEHLIDDLGMGKRGVKSAGFVVIKKNTVPSILIELGFLSNSGDYSKLTDPEFQDYAAQSIYDSAVALFDAYPTGR